MRHRLDAERRRTPGGPGRDAGTERQGVGSGGAGERLGLSAESTAIFQSGIFPNLSCPSELAGESARIRDLGGRVGAEAQVSSPG